MDLSLSDVQTVAGAAIVVAILIQLIKGDIPEKRVPHAAVILGMLVVIAATLLLGERTAPAIGNAVLKGLLAGASAVGLYQVQKGGPLQPKPPEQ